MSGAREDFVKTWPVNYYYWKTLTDTVWNICDEGLREQLKLKCTITCRTKSVASVKRSVARREKLRETPYEDEEEILGDMHDLSGVRVTLAFPRDVEVVKSFLEKEFGSVEQRYWGLDEEGRMVEQERMGRFIGYRATDFLIKWKQPKSSFQRAISTGETHIGRTVQIQVTSIIMNAWQEAHDLIHQHLSGNVSTDEKYLLDMINGLAHAGEVALNQLQEVFKRRIEAQTRVFSDEYELGTWLKSHIPEILRLKWNDGPYMQCLTTLFDVLQVFRLETPEKLREVLTSNPLPDFSIASLDQNLYDLLHSKLIIGPSTSKWQEAFGADPTNWAALAICANRAKIPFPRSGSQLARLQAFVIVNTINFALSEPSRVTWIKDAVEVALQPHNERRGAIIGCLYKLLVKHRVDGSSPTGGSEFEASEDAMRNMSCLWESFVQVMKDWDSVFLRVGCALSCSGIAVMPTVAHLEQVGVETIRSIAWPGVINNGIAQLWKLPKDLGPMVSIITIGLNSEQTHSLHVGSFEWRRHRISLGYIAEGKGWQLADGPPTPSRSSRKPMTPHASPNYNYRRPGLMRSTRPSAGEGTLPHPDTRGGGLQIQTIRESSATPPAKSTPEVYGNSARKRNKRRTERIEYKGKQKEEGVKEEGVKEEKEKEKEKDEEKGVEGKKEKEQEENL